MLYGYGGTILYVDLTSGNVRKEPLTKEMAEKYIGGEGFALRLAIDNIPVNVDPLSPDAPIIIGGPALGGTFAPPSGKVSWVMKFTLPADETGKCLIGSAKAGSANFPVAMKQAGYDAIVVKGKADKLSYLKISDDEVEICDAGEYRGRSPGEVTTALRRKHGMGVGVAAIGISGERGVRWSLAFQDSQGSIGRHGTGAVFGSKNLKAICISGTKGIKVAEPDKFMQKATEMYNGLRNHPATPLMQQAGYTAFMSVFENTLSQGNWPVHKLGFLHDAPGADTYIHRITADACCPMGCKCCLVVPRGPNKGRRTHIHALQVAVLSDRLEIDDPSQAVDLLTEYNEAGLCGTTFMGMADWLSRLYAEGKVSKETIGFEMKRDVESYWKLLDLIIRREGIGDILAEGHMAISEHLGVDVREDTVGIGIAKGCHPNYDGRFTTLDPLRFIYIVCPRPNHAGYHDITTVPSDVPHWPMPLQSIRDNYSKGAVLADELESAFEPVPYYGAGFNVGLVTIINERNGTLYNCWGTCSIFPTISASFVGDMNELWHYASGIDKDMGDLVECADRIYNIYRYLNAREGFGRKYDWVEAWFTPRMTPTGPVSLMDYYRTRTLSKDDVNKLLDDYYQARGWDIETGNPTKEKLREYGVSV